MAGTTNPFRRAAPAPSKTKESQSIASEANPFCGSSAPPTVPHRRSPQAQSRVELTPLRAHYLKKTLVALQLHCEFSQLHRRDALELIGPPFRTSHLTRRAELPLIRHLLHRFVLSFPFLKSAPEDFFSNKVQLFVERLIERDMIVLNASDDSASAATRITQKVQKYACMLVSSGISIKGIGEDIVRLSDCDRQRLVLIEAQGAAAGASKGELDVNVVAVRCVVARGRLRTRTREEFLVETTVDDRKVLVSRRHNDFVRLHLLLRTKLPQEDVPAPPPKDHSATEITGSLQETLADPLNDGAFDMTVTAPPRLVREKNRLMLRAYLHSLLAIPAVADSDALHEFLTSNPTSLSAAEHEDATVRRRADALREEERQKFAEHTAERVAQLRKHFGAFKKELMQPEGLSNVFTTIRTCPHVSELPQRYRVLVDWAVTSLASGLFHIFVGRDTSSQAFAQLKHVHSIMPYFMVRSILRISNPVAMMRAFLDLFLVQPFGQKSLLQRMFTGQLQEEITELTDVRTRVLEKIADPVLGHKVDEFIALPADMQQLFYEQASVERLDIMTVIMRAPIGGELAGHQVHRVVLASKAYEQLRRSRRQAAAMGRPEPEPSNDDAWLYEDLHVYLSLGSTVHEKQQLIGLVQDHATTELLKDIITIFYTPLAQVYKAANIADTLGDVQVFVSDLIKTVEENQERTLLRVYPTTNLQSV